MRLIDADSLIRLVMDSTILGKGFKQAFVALVNGEPTAQPEHIADEWCTDCKEYDQGKHCCPRFNRVIHEIINEAQPERKKGKWIPCDERLPDKTDFYLIQYSRKICADEMAVAFYSVEESRLDSKYSWEFKSIGDVKKVIAWMPLPEPYVPKENK